MKSMLFEDWKHISKDCKIVYYPELYYGNQNNLKGRFVDFYTVEEEVRRHVNDPKVN